MKSTHLFYEYQIKPTSSTRNDCKIDLRNYSSINQLKILAPWNWMSKGVILLTLRCSLWIKRQFTAICLCLEFGTKRQSWYYQGTLVSTCHEVTKGVCHSKVWCSNDFISFLKKKTKLTDMHWFCISRQTWSDSEPIRSCIY